MSDPIPPPANAPPPIPPPANAPSACEPSAPGPAPPDPPVLADLAAAIDLLALTLRSGAGVVMSLRAVAGLIRPDLGRDLSTVAAALEWGVGAELAWSQVRPAWQPVAQALRLADAAGVPPAELLVAAAHDIRTAEEERLESAAARLSVRVVIPLGLCFLPAFCLVAVVPLVVALASQVLGAW